MVSKTKIKAAEIAERDEKIHNLELDLKRLEKEVINHRTVRNEIFKLSNVKHKLPKWCLEKSYKQLKNSPGAPILLLSDWHGGEVVKPAEIYNVNNYNLKIMEQRARTLIETTVNVLKHNNVIEGDYPGIIVCLAGDMISGDIHEELRDTNEMPSIPTVIHMSNVLIECFDTLIKEFGNVLVPCVTGNHGRNTLKMRAKTRAHTSYDWLLYMMLESHYTQKYIDLPEEEKPIRFLVSLAPDQLFKVYNTRFLLTHGDTLGHGGDGIIGSVGPIIRGDSKTRSRNLQIGMPYDIMLTAHYHQLMWMTRFIANGSLIGYNEFASNMLRAPFEPPKQALFIVHPDHGVTYKFDILVEHETKKKTDWVSWQTA